MKRLLVLIFLMISPNSFASDYEYFDVEDNRSTVHAGVEGALLIWGAYHIESIPHEAVHGLTALSFGTKVKYWHILPMLQAVSYDREDDERRREDVFFSSMSAPIFSRMTTNLPRKILPPTEAGVYSRWTGAYWIMSFTTTYVTLIGSWAEFSQDDNNPDVGWDFYNASGAVSDKRSERAAFLSAITLLMGFDLYYSFEELGENSAVFAGAKGVRVKPKDGVSFSVGPTSIAATYTLK